MSTRIGYLSSLYPAVSHTFIRREVEALRAMGLHVETFSMRPGSTAVAGEQRDEADSTWSILPRGPLGVVIDHVKGVGTHPVRYVRTLLLALRHRTPGLRELIWSGFHFTEAIILGHELERRGTTHLHCHFSNAGGTVGMLAAHYLNLPWSLTLHGSGDFDAPTRVLLREKIRVSKLTACVSHFARATAMRLSEPAQWNKLVVVHCGVDLAQAPVRPARARGQRLRILSVGRLSAEKAYRGLVEALDLTRKRGFDVELRILGEGPERADIEEFIAKLGLVDVCTLPGAVGEQQVRAELEAADVFAMASFMEGLPVAIMEAMACGVPVVAPRVAGIPELVEHGRTGLAFTPGRWTELADGLSEALEGGDKIQAMTQAARARIEQEFDVRVTARELADLAGWKSAP